MPQTTAAAIFPPPTTEPEPQVQHTVQSQQQTTVYVAKHLGKTSQTPMPQYGPDKIVIPISSLYPGGASRVSTPSTTVHEEVEHHEAKGGIVIAKQFKVRSFLFSLSVACLSTQFYRDFQLLSSYHMFQEFITRRVHICTIFPIDLEHVHD